MMVNYPNATTSLLALIKNGFLLRLGDYEITTLHDFILVSRVSSSAFDTEKLPHVYEMTRAGLTKALQVLTEKRDQQTPVFADRD